MTPTMPLDFIEWLGNSGFKDLNEFIEYLSTIEESIEVRRMNPNFNVIADSNRPYLHWVYPNGKNEGLYIGIQGQSKQNRKSDYNWRAAAVDVKSIPFNEYIGGNSYFAWRGLSYGSMRSQYVGADGWKRFLNDFETHINHKLNFQRPNWVTGAWGGDGNSKAWYLDEIMGKGINMVAMNWLDNPLKKYIKEYRIYLKEEKKKLASLKRKEKMDSELISYATYKTRKEIKFNNKKIELLKGKCSDGIYFDLVKINYIMTKYRNNDVDIFANTRMNTFNIQLQGIMGQLNNLTNPENRETNNNGWWPQFHRFMIDLCGDGYNLRSSPEGWGSEIANWTTWGSRDLASPWFIELMDSGLDLSYYIVDEVNKSHYGENIKMAEDTIIFDFRKKGGPISKSKYYNYIEEGTTYKSSEGANHILPKWMFIEYKGGKGYKL